MRKTVLAVTVSSLFVSIGGGTAIAGNLYENQDITGSANWTQTYDNYEKLIVVNKPETYTVSGYDKIEITHKQDGDNPIFHASNAGTVKATAQDVTLTGQSKSNTGSGPILIHAYGGTVDISADNDITLTGASNNAIMSQAVAASKSDSLVKLTAGGNVTISTNAGAVLVGLLQSNLLDRTSALVIDAGKNVTINATGKDSDGLTLYNTNKLPENYQGDAGKAIATINAQENVRISGNRFGIIQSTPQGESTTEASINADSIDVAGKAGAIYSGGVVPHGNTLLLNAENISLSSENIGDFATVQAGSNADIAFGNGQNATTVTISASAGNNAISTVSTSSVHFNKSTVSIDGAVKSNGTLDLNNSLLNLSTGTTLYSNVLTGTNSQIVLNDLQKNKVVIDQNASKDLDIQTSGDVNDKYDSVEKAKKALEDSISITNVQGGSVSLSGEAGKTSDGWTLASDGTIVTTKNTVLSSLSNYSSATLIQWRDEADRLHQRLGDLRGLTTTAGAWARVYGYDSSYSDGTSLDFKATSVQAGSDVKVGSNWIVGGAFSYTNGSGTLSNGSADTDGYTLAAYASGLFDCGGYVDLVGRIGRISTDITAYNANTTFHGSYDNTTFGFSAEVGYHWNLTPIFYVEPQAELAYGWVKGDDFTASNGVSVKQDNFQSLVGRVGVRTGANFADNTGSVYLHASVNHDFLGDADFTAAALGGAEKHEDVDISGTWYSYGVGAQFNTSKNMSFYGTLERANGSDYSESYRFSVGASYRF